MAGGKNPATDSELSSVDVYDVKSDRWIENRVPNMNTARWYHSSCTLADMIYVFFGQREKQTVMSVERLDLKSIHRRQTVAAT